MTNNETEFLKQEIAKSGYPLESYVTSVISSRKNWILYFNPYFWDKDENKGREIDVKAAYSSDELYRKGSSVFMSLSLVIECKRIRGNAWVFFKNPTGLYSPILRCSSFDFFEAMEGNTLSSLISSKKGTHFDRCRTKSTQYDEYIVSQNKSNKRKDNIWSSVIKIIKACSGEIENLKNQNDESIEELRLEGLDRWVDSPDDIISFVYPVIVFEGKLYEASIENEIVLKRRHYIQLHVDFKSRNYEGRFCIDIVSRPYFASFFRHVENDANVFEKRILKHQRKHLDELKKVALPYFYKHGWLT